MFKIFLLLLAVDFASAEDVGNEFFLSTAYGLFNGPDHCIDQIMNDTDAIKKATDANDVTPLVERIGKCNMNATTDVATQANVTVDVLLSNVAGAFNDILFAGCQLAKVAVDAGCKMPENGTMDCTFMACIRDAIIADKSPQCARGHATFSKVATYIVSQACSVPAKRMLNQTDFGNEFFLSTAYGFFNGPDHCIDQVMNDTAAIQTATDAKDVTPLVERIGKCNMNATMDVATKANVTVDVLLSNVAGAFNDILFAGCQLAKVAVDAGCKMPENGTMDCAFMACIRDAIIADKSPQCARGHATFAMVATYIVSEACSVPAKRMLNQTDVGNEFFLSTAYTFFNGPDHCIDQVMNDTAAIQTATDAKDVTPLVERIGKCNMNATMDVATQANVTVDVLLSNVAGAFNDIFFAGCQLAKVAVDAGCKTPENGTMDCTFMSCIRDAIVADNSTQCARGHATFAKVATYVVSQACSVPTKRMLNQTDVGNEFFLSTAYGLFNGPDHCIDQVMNDTAAIQTATDAKDVTPLVERIGKCNMNATMDVATQANVTADVLLSNVAGAFNDILFAGCQLAKVAVDAGCKMPENDTMDCTFMACIRGAIIADKSPQCARGHATFAKVATYIVSMACSVPAKRQLPQNDLGNQIFIDTLNRVFNDGGCVDKVLADKDAMQAAFAAQDVTPLADRVGKCSNATEYIANIANITTDVLTADIAESLNDVLFRGCEIGKIVVDYGCKVPAENEPKCEFMQCVMDALIADTNPKCAKGHVAFIGTAQYLLGEACESEDRDDLGNRIFMDTLYSIFNGDHCIDNVLTDDEAMQNAFTAQDVTPLCDRIATCSNATAEVAKAANVTTDVLAYNIAEGLNDVLFRGCKIGQVVVDYGCKVPAEDEPKCDFVKCALDTITADTDSKCAKGHYAFIGTAKYIVSQVCTA